MWSRALHQLLTCRGDGDCENWEETQGLRCSAIYKRLKTPLRVLMLVCCIQTMLFNTSIEPHVGIVNIILSIVLSASF